MKRRGRLPALLVALGLALPSCAALAQPKSVGNLASREGRKKVTGGLPEEPFRDLKVPDKLPERMRVKTGEASGARVTIGRYQGAVRIGPKSQLELRRAILDFATGRVDELDFWAELGRLRFVFFRPPGDASQSPLGAAPGEVWIRTPNGTEVRLAGTDVQVEVAKDGSTSVYVIEGAVSVRSRDGSEVRVEAGRWTWVGIDLPPTPPAPFGVGTDAPGPGPFPEDLGIPPDPPSLSPERDGFARDLPKAGPPP
ncbi:MAG TPA: hypothetical protein VF756_13580 [Thermoanaerobaculia bacterium]